MHKIVVGKYVGFCTGVERAIKLALEQAATHSHVYTYGELIHNTLMVQNLANKGIKVVKNIEDIHPYDTVIIRTHGVSKAEYDKLIATGATIIDATCAFVKNIHNKVAEYSQKGYSIILIGHKNHPETNGIIGWCKDYQIVKSTEEIDFSKSDKFYVVVQTTFDASEYQKIVEYIEKTSKSLDKSVVIFNSICYTTMERQKEAIAIASQSDVVLVVGDKNSSNTMRLKTLAEQYAKQVFLIENVGDVRSLNIKNTAYVGIIAGASTPKELITEVITVADETKGIVGDDKVNETAAVETAETKTFADYMSETKYAPRTYREGKKVYAEVQSADESGITVSILGGGKNDSGFIAADVAELDGVDYDPANYKKGDQIDAIIIAKTDSKQKSINLSKKAADELKVDDEKVEAILNGEVFEMKVERKVNGGLTGKIGSYVVFIPASELRDRYVKDLDKYVGQTLALKIAPPKAPKLDENGQEIVEEGKERRKNSKRIVASHKIVVAEEKAAKVAEFLSSSEINQIVEGKVKRFSPIGAFVSVNGYDCLAHISQLAYHHIADPSEALEIGKVYEFVVLAIDHENGHVSLGYKQLQSKRYDAVRDKYAVGTVLTAKVVRVKKFAAFVSLEDGIEGKIHISQIGHEWVGDINTAIAVGQEVEVKVIAFENDDITLSIKELLPAPVEKDADKEEAKDDAKEVKAADKKAKKAKKEEAETEQKEYRSSTAGATMAGLFKGLDIDFDDKD